MKVEKKQNYEIHHPPERLAELVDKQGGRPLEDMIADASEGLARLSEHFPEIVGQSVAKMRDGLALIETGDAAGLRTIFKEAFNIKGQAAIFNYAFLGDLAKSLCELTEDQTTHASRQHDLIKVNIDALAWALAGQVRDGDDPRAVEIIVKLEEARDGPQ